MKTKALALTCILLGLTSLAQAQTAQTTTKSDAAPSSFDSFANDVKHPLDWFTWGCDIRIRDEYSDGIQSLTTQMPRDFNEQNVIRFRGRLWASATVVTQPFRQRAAFSRTPRMDPPGIHGHLPPPRRHGVALTGIVDNLNVKWTNILDQPFAITAGRQDVMMGDLGDWWLVADGTPVDGSWTFFLDAVRMSYDARDIKTKFDVIGLYQHSKPSDPMPTIDNSGSYFLTEQDEQGVILYGSNKSVENMQIDGYFIYKHDNKVRVNGDNASIYTAGSKITGNPAEHWTYSVEGAYQFGQKQDGTVTYPVVENGWRTLSAYAGKLKLSYLFKDSLNNQLSLVGEFLSGDNPDSTGQDEMFDVLWGRWPRWSELYIYSYVNETSGKIAQMNNLGRVGASWSFNPVKKLTCSLMYNAMFAPESTPTRTVDSSLFTSTGNFRGHYIQAILKYQVNKKHHDAPVGRVRLPGRLLLQPRLARFRPGGGDVQFLICIGIEMQRRCRGQRLKNFN